MAGISVIGSTDNCWISFAGEFVLEISKFFTGIMKIRLANAHNILYNPVFNT